MPTTLQNAAREAVQAKPCQKSANACKGCRDNFILRDLHGPLDVLDGPAVHGQMERRRACTASPAARKPCLPQPQLDATAPAPAVKPVPTVSTLVLHAQDGTEAARAALHSYTALADMLAHGPTLLLDDDLQTLLHVMHAALHQRLGELDQQVDTFLDVLRQRPTSVAKRAAFLPPDRLDDVAFNAGDLADNLLQASAAFAALRDLAHHASATTAANLSITVQLVANHLAMQLLQMDDMLDSLHAELMASEATA